jgi:myo-inositol-1(or 4)-monophosphatase
MWDFLYLCMKIGRLMDEDFCSMNQNLQLEKLTRGVCEIAKQAGAYIREERRKFSLESVERKHAHDYVSYVDKGSEKQIVSALRQLLPEAGFITEEGTTETEEGRGKMTLGEHSETLATRGTQEENSSLTWVVDPLDGTTNFIHQYAPYAVSIALLQGKEILIGVVYEVCHDECYCAWKGGGAYVELKGESLKLKVSNQKIQDALLCLQLPYNSDAYKPVIKHLIDKLYGNVGSVRMCGSAAMALCYVASGRYDGYAEKYIGQWDFMAGALIVKEAGGMVTNYEGSEDFTQGNNVVATNGIIQQDLLNVIKTA